MMFSYVCPYVTARYRRGCTITVPHWHYPRWEFLIPVTRDLLAAAMLGLWWPQSRERYGSKP